MARRKVRRDGRKLKMVDESQKSEVASFPGLLTGDETVDEIVAEHPDLRVPLMSYGVCTCCSGSMTLRQNAEAREIPLAAILKDLRHELEKTG